MMCGRALLIMFLTVMSGLVWASLDATEVLQIGSGSRGDRNGAAAEVEFNLPHGVLALWDQSTYLVCDSAHTWSDTGYAPGNVRSINADTGFTTMLANGSNPNWPATLSPRHMTLGDESRREVWMTTYSPNGIWKLNADTGDLQQHIAAGGEGIVRLWNATAAAWKLLVTQSNRIVAYDEVSGALTDWSVTHASFAGLRGMTASPDKSQLAVADNAAAAVFVIDVATASVTREITGIGPNVMDVAWSASGEWIVCARITVDSQAISTKTWQVQTISTGSSYGIWLGADGTLVGARPYTVYVMDVPGLFYCDPSICLKGKFDAMSAGEKTQFLSEIGATALQSSSAQSLRDTWCSFA